MPIGSPDEARRLLCLLLLWVEPMPASSDRQGMTALKAP